jgi:hypothetical protein
MRVLDEKDELKYYRKVLSTDNKKTCADIAERFSNYDEFMRFLSE